MAGLASSTSFQAQAAHFRFSPDFGDIAASHRSATNRLTRDEARRGGELHQAAGPAALVAADKRGVTGLQPHIHDSPRKFRLTPNSGRVVGHHCTHAAAESTTRNSVSRINCTTRRAAHTWKL